ncbi:C40 family peptidase [Streptomyces sp. LP11]|uniref:C40 family peptidase n=1 Tax=Streptomyces pyxinicus TaxID=2970331 RepID=A0ABT2B2Y2_9ACTN|nr:C40 family peptidase [Streptomyces sp. LP11]MCS0602874.1 C40 family peptidase [Streptomyces sp. LP11]
MPHTAHIRSHRKPRRSASSLAMRAGVAGGVLSTLAVAGASGSANAAEPVTQTLELPTLTADLAAQAAKSADATQQAAANYQLQAERDSAAAKAAKQAKADLADARHKAAAAKKKAEEAARKQAAARANRSAERTTLSASADTGSTSASTTSTGSSTATGSAAAVVSFVKAQIGKAYVSGATGPSAYDCSGLVQSAFKQVGVSLPRVSQDQSTAGTQVSLDNLQPGDILYWGSAGSAYHVAVYVGDGMFVGAQNPSTGVAEKPLSYDPPTGAVRVL